MESTGILFQKRKERRNHSRSRNLREEAKRTAHGRRPQNGSAVQALLLFVFTSRMRLRFAVLREAVLTLARQFNCNGGFSATKFFLFFLLSKHKNPGNVPNALI